MKIPIVVPALMLLAATLFAQTATAPSAGNGSSGNPYQIATLNNLYWVTQNSSSWSSHFVQTADIDATTSSTWDIGQGYSPIGDAATQFTGSYDGQSYKITGPYIHRPSTWRVGLFGFVGNFSSSAIIRNVRLERAQVTGGANNIGALVGALCSSTVTNCSSNGSVTGGTSVGGLIGYIYYYSTVLNCYSSGSVTGSGQFTGGLIGQQYSASYCKDCYSTDTVTGYDACVGGLIGYQWNSYTDTNCYSTGPVNRSVVTYVQYVGGLIGYQSYSAVVNCFWDTATSHQQNSAAGIGKSTADMKTPSTFTGAGWDLATVWSMNPSINNGYPFLASNIPTFVEGTAAVTPRTFSLLQNYPNPFNPNTTIQYALPARAHVTLTVYNTLGQKVAELVNAEKETGSYDVTFNANGLASGVYLYRMQAGNYVETKKLILLR